MFSYPPIVPYPILPLFLIQLFSYPILQLFSNLHFVFSSYPPIVFLSSHCFYPHIVFLSYPPIVFLSSHCFLILPLLSISLSCNVLFPACHCSSYFDIFIVVHIFISNPSLTSMQIPFQCHFSSVKTPQSMWLMI